MLTMTDAAGSYLLELVDEADLPEDGVLRLVSTLDGLELTEDLVRPGDTTMEHDGQIVLVLNGPMIQMCADQTLDVTLTPDGLTLTWQEECED